jgi:uncharacterized membrane protein HdeD (DUF308 family)
MDVKKSFQLKALGMKRWWIAFLVSALIIVFGLCTIFLPHFFGNMLMIVLGIALVYEGLSGFVIVALISRYWLCLDFSYLCYWKNRMVWKRDLHLDI